MRVALFVFLFFISFSVMAQERDTVTVDLASDHVDITTGFNGTTLELFGVRRNDNDIAVIVRGPLRTMSVRKKENVLGAWINSSTETFRRVPSYYNYALSVPLEQIAPPDRLRQYGIAPENLEFNRPDSKDKDRAIFREALIRNKQKQSLYAKEAGNIKFLGSDFFRADFYIPSNVPVGDYEVQVLAFNRGNLEDIQTRIVRVAQVGSSARIHEFSQKHSFLYGALCVVLAMFAGWFSNRIRRGKA